MRTYVGFMIAFALGCQSRPTEQVAVSPVVSTDNAATGIVEYPHAAPAPGTAYSLVIEPVSGTSNTTADPAVRLVDSAGRGIPLAILEELSVNVSLRAIPEGTDVAVAKEIVTPTEGDPRGSIVLHPKKPLGDSAYAVIISKVPALVHAPKFAAYSTKADGSIESRFQRASDPRVVSVIVCRKTASLFSGRVVFSEPVAVGDDPSSFVALTPRVGVVSAKIAAPSTAPGAKAGASYAQAIDFELEGAADGKFDVEVKAGVKSQTGKEAAKATYSLSAAAFVPWGDCLAHHVAP